MTTVVPGRPLARAVVVAAAIACATLASASARTADVSANWSGYVVTGRTFTGVSGTWTVAPADCLAKASPSTAAAFWVGLGGSVAESKKIEQIGTDSDCNPDGTESYYAWYELWPKQAVLLSLDIEAGDRVHASVRLHGNAVELVLVDLTSGRVFDRRLALADPDTSSAEWIGEAPAIAVKTGTPFLPLTKFDRVTFSHSTATVGAHTAPIGDAAWKAARVRLDSLRGVGRGTADRFLGRLNRARVVPSPLDAAGAGFSLRWASGAA